MADRPPDWIVPFDGLRAIAMLFVLSTHLATTKANLGARFGLGLFLMQSGYLITAMLLREEAKYGAVDLRAFYIRRASRLFPSYYVVLAVYAILFLVVGLQPHRRPVFVDALPYYLTYMQEIPFVSRGGDIPFFQTWALALQEKFYLLWPILAFGVRRNFRTRLWVAIIAFAAASVLRTPDGWGKYIGAISPIAGGCILALLLDSRERYQQWTAWAARWSWLIGASWLSWHLVAYFGSPPLQMSTHYFYPVIVAGVLLACLSETSLARIVSIAPLRFLGQISYGFFLLHVLARSVTAALLSPIGLQDSPLVVFCLTALLATAGAWPLYHVVEAPLRDWGRRLARGKRQAVPVPAPQQLPGV